MLLRPTRDNKKQKTNNERIRYPAKFPGLGDALIFFSFPFLASRQEKERSPQKRERSNHKKAGYAQEESSYAPGVFYVSFLVANFYYDAPAAIRRGYRCIVSGCWRSK